MKKSLFAAMTAAVVSCAANEYFVCRVPEMKTAPVIDGKLGEKAWDSAARLPGFGNSTGSLSYKKQDLYLCYDKENLYVGFRTEIEWEAAFKPIPFDDLTIWTVDSLDIALIPEPAKKNDVVRFILERAGGKADMKAKGQVKQPPAEWNPEWKSACRLIPQSFMSAYLWEAEVAIPWKSLGIPAPEKGTMIPAQFLHCFGNIRKDLNGNPDRAVTWAPVLKGRDWINPHEFGELHFCGDLPAFRADKEVVYGVKGSCTAPIKGELSGLLWEVGKSGQPLRTAKKIPTDGSSINWPEPVNSNRSFNSMMYWRLNDEHGTVAAGRYTTVVTPIFNVQAEINHQDQFLFALAELENLKLKGKHSVHMELKDSDGKIIGEKVLELAEDDLHSKLALSATGILLLAGTVLILMFDFHNPDTLGPYNFPEKLMISFFQSTTTRTAGFFTIPQQHFSNGSAFVSLLFMFIGGSPVGTAGGIKTVTFFVLAASVLADIRNQNQISVFNRAIPRQAVSRSLAVMGMSFSIVLISTLLLSFTTQAPALDILYETVSATATVGLTRNLTGTLGTAGKLIITCNMFLGRIGPISLAFAFQMRHQNKNLISNPVEEISIG